MEPQILLTDNGIRIGTYAPGNGFVYRAIAVPFSHDKPLGRLGRVRRAGWLVVNCNTKVAHLFRGGDEYLSDNYIKEKLGGFEFDYPHFGDLVRKLLGREKKVKKIDVAALLEQAVSEGFITCPQCQNNIEIDAESCHCGWENILVKGGYV